MPFCSPQRYIANNRNLVLDAVLTPSSVQAVTDQVQDIPLARAGTARATLTGSYTGAEEAEYEVEIVDTIVATSIATAPVFTGAGSGTLTDIAVTGVAQVFTIELGNDGIPTLSAGIEFEGVRIVAAVEGDVGNGLSLTIDQTPMTFTEQPYSLLADMKAASGGEANGIEGAAFDWDTKVLSADNIIPANAHRVAFGDDQGTVYLNYKRYVDGVWLYHFVPAIKRDIPKGTRISFVTGGRDVDVHDNDSPSSVLETFTDIITVYDLLNAIKTTSTVLQVVGVVAYDRSPSGQASKDLLARTDAHVQASSGEGSAAATGFVDTYANSGAATELVTATCNAVSSQDHPLARLGRERWDLKGSVSGALGVVTTGIPYVGSTFGLTIPERLPASYGVQRGRFTVTDITYVTRDAGEPPPIDVVAMTLGSEAVDQTITLKYTARPSGDCDTAGMPIPRLDPACLGILETEGGTAVGYQADTITKLIDLWDWHADVVRANSSHSGSSGTVSPWIIEPNDVYAIGYSVESQLQLVERFEAVIAEVDPLVGAYRTAGMTAWDTALAEMKSDVTAMIAGGAPPAITGKADQTIAASDAIMRYHNGTEYRVRKAADIVGTFGFAGAAYAVEDVVTVKQYGIASGLTALTVNAQYFPDSTTPGAWAIDDLGIGIASIMGIAVSSTELLFNGPFGGAVTSTQNVMISERFKSRLAWVLISGGLSPLGKSDASILASGDGCWRDYGDTHYWTVVGSDRGAYAPAFNNKPYYSSTRASNQDAYYSTKEFAFQINVKCPELLEVDDTITLSIGGSQFGGTYSVGDILTLPIIAAQPLTLAGGQDGNSILDFYVSGTVDGPLSNFVYDSEGSPPVVDYSDGGLSFTYSPGGIPNAKGDKWTLAVEGGHYRWRKDGGTWSADTVIPAVSTAFDSGLSIAFIPGAAPAFVDGDVFEFRSLQPWAVSNLRRPNKYRWQWTGATATLDIDFGSVQPLPDFTIARHTLPVGATIAVHGGSAAGLTDLWSESLTWQAGAIFKEPATLRSARYVRLALASATGGGIGYLNLGAATTTELSADVQLNRNYKIERGGAGLDEGGKFLARTVSGDVVWTEAALTETDVDGIAALLDWVKENNDEPLVIVPNVTRPDEAYAVRILSDDVRFEELSGYNRDVSIDRRYQIELPLAGVY